MEVQRHLPDAEDDAAQPSSSSNAMARGGGNGANGGSAVRPGSLLDVLQNDLPWSWPSPKGGKAALLLALASYVALSMAEAFSPFTAVAWFFRLVAWFALAIWATVSVLALSREGAPSPRAVQLALLRGLPRDATQQVLVAMARTLGSQEATHAARLVSKDTRAFYDVTCTSLQVGHGNGHGGGGGGGDTAGLQHAGLAQRCWR